jgi:hypothetical protein
VRTLFVLLGVAVAVLALGPYRSQSMSRLSALRAHLFPRPVYVQPSSQSPPSARTLEDLSATTAWTGPPGTSLSFGFSPAVKLFKVGVLNGDAPTQPGYKSDGRARRVDLTAYDVSGRRLGRRRLTLGDKPGFQQFLVPFSPVARLVVTVVDQWPGSHANVAIRELEFFRRA